MKIRTFKDPLVLSEMIYLRTSGWPLKELAFKYSCNVTSIQKACIRQGISREIPLLPRPKIIFQTAYIDWNGERVNRGKLTYNEYLKESLAKGNTPAKYGVLYYNYASYPKGTKDIVHNGKDLKPEISKK